MSKPLSDMAIDRVLRGLFFPRNVTYPQDELDILASIQVNEDVLIYADWIEEQGDDRAEMKSEKGFEK